MPTLLPSDGKKLVMFQPRWEMGYGCPLGDKHFPYLPQPTLLVVSFQRASTPPGRPSADPQLPIFDLRFCPYDICPYEILIWEFVNLKHRAQCVCISLHTYGGFPGGLAVKNPPVMQEMQETWVWSLGQEDPLMEGTATHSSILAWRIPWTEKPGGLQSMGSQRVRHNCSDWAYRHIYMVNAI